MFARATRRVYYTNVFNLACQKAGQKWTSPTLSLIPSRSKHTSILNRVLANSVRIADKSASICREVMASGQLDIVEKTGSDDLQTRADRSVQDCIVGSLRENFPGIAVIGEEGDDVDAVKDDWIVKEEDEEALELKIPDDLASASLEDLTVWVDPLDGTKEFTEGLVEHVTILIGIAVGKRAVAGVINQPYFTVCFSRLLLHLA